MDEPLMFLAACVTLLIAPGPTNALMFAAGASRGGWRGLLPLGLAVLAAYAVSVGVARVALEPILSASPLLAKGARAAIGLYVLWLAVALWSSTLRRASGAGVRAWQVFTTTLLNPKGFVMAFVILPAGGFEIWRHLLGAAVVVVLASASWGLAGLALARAAGGSGARLAPRLSAIALGIFGGLTLSSAFG